MVKFAHGVFAPRADRETIPRMRPTVNVAILGAALAGIVLFAQGLRVVDTIGLLVCGAVAGAAIAATAAARRKRP